MRKRWKDARTRQNGTEKRMAGRVRKCKRKGENNRLCYDKLGQTEQKTGEKWGLGFIASPEKTPEQW